MPFTLSHAAAALPLHYLLRDAVVLPALVIGCFIPDIPYFLPDPLFDINAHTLPGLVLFGIPSGYVIYALWQRVFLSPVLALLPRRYALLFETLHVPERAVATWWSIALSLFAGAVTHIVWDAFTHRRGLVVNVLPALTQPLMQVGSHTLMPYTLLQHGSTVAGLAWLGLYVRRRMRDSVAESAAACATLASSLSRRLCVIAVLSIAAVALVCVDFAWTATPLSAYNVVCRTISSAALVTTIYALVWHWTYRRAVKR